MVFEKWRSFVPNFKWLGFQILNPIWYQDYLQTNFFLTIQIRDLTGFQIPTVRTLKVECTVGARIPNIWILEKRMFQSSVFNGKKQNGGHFVLISNGPDHLKTELYKMAALA